MYHKVWFKSTHHYRIMSGTLLLIFGVTVTISLEKGCNTKHFVSTNTNVPVVNAYIIY